MHSRTRAGKQLTMRVSDVMRHKRDLGICAPDDVLIKQIGCVLRVHEAFCTHQ
jgi:hypothetical protein